jgi:hypothetical protein
MSSGIQSSGEENAIVTDTDPLIQQESVNESPIHSSGEFYKPKSLQSLPELKHRASTGRTFINITKCFVGAASLELPWVREED